MNGFEKLRLLITILLFSLFTFHFSLVVKQQSYAVPYPFKDVSLLIFLCGDKLYAAQFAFVVGEYKPACGEGSG
jgi:hypothetical protein